MLYFLVKRLRIILIIKLLCFSTISFAEKLDGILVSQFDYGMHLRSNTSCVLPWGGTLANSSSVTAYSSSLPLGTCAGVSEVRTCSAGTLSGNYTNSSCLNGCTGTPWGAVASGYSNTAYSSATPASTCATASQSRLCTNGTMSGSYTVTSCSNGCSLPWGGYIASGSNTTAYSSATPAGPCTSYDETRSCSNGTLSGSFTSNTCANGCSLPWGGYIASGSNTTAYSSATPAGPCTSYDETRSCSNGTLSGSFTSNTCANGCSLPWGGYIASGSNTTAYSSATPAGLCSSYSQTRSCTSGTLSGSYSLGSCANGCTLPWGGYIASSSSATAYISALPAGACSSQSRTCSSGTLSGTYTVQTCNAGCPAYGLVHGGSVTGYAASSAASAAACGSKGTRTCTNGAAGGSGGQYSTCQYPTTVVTDCSPTNPGYPSILNWTTVQGWYKAKGRCGDPTGMQYWSDEIISLGDTNAAKASFDASWTPNFAACGGTHAACLCGSSSYTYTDGSTTSVCIKP